MSLLRRAVLAMALAGLAPSPAAAGSPWSTLPDPPIAGRAFHSVVWTGDEMLVWGGASRGRLFDDGAAFDPDTRTWRVLAPAPLEGRTGHVTAWTGERMLVWGGCCGADGRELADGASYDPAADRWRTLPRAPIEARTGHAAVWTGEELLIWGGHVFGEEFADGAAYRAEANAWRPMTDAPVAARYGHTAVWTGEQMLVWGGATQDGVLGDGAAYHPARGAAGSWTVLPAAGIEPRSDHVAAWLGDGMVVAAGCCSPDGAELGDAAAYRSADESWGQVDAGPLGTRQGAEWVVADGRLIVVGGRRGLDQELADAVSLDAGAEVFSAFPGPPVDGRTGHGIVWTGEEILVWGGCCDASQRAFADGASVALEPGAPPRASPGSSRPEAGERVSALVLLTMLVIAGAAIAVGVALYLGRPVLR